MKLNILYSIIFATLSLVKSNAQTYATLPLNESFNSADLSLNSNWSTSFSNSSGRIEQRNLSGNWPQFGTTTGPNNTSTSGNGMAIYNTSNLASDNTLNADLRLNLQSSSIVSISFAIVDWGTAYSANPLRIYFSNNGGTSFGSTFITVPLNLAPHSDGIWNNISINISSLASSNNLNRTATSVVRFSFTLKGSGNTTNPKLGNQFVYLDNLSVTSTNPLPVELLNFDVITEEKSNKLLWSTLSETNNSHFEIEKSTDGENFYYIGEINGNGTSYNIKKYEFNDPEISSKKSYYRIKQVDFSNDFEYSPITVIHRPSSNDINIAVRNNQLHITGTDIYSLELYDYQGKLVQQFSTNTENNFHHFFIDTSLSNEIYILRCIESNGFVTTKKIIF